MAPRVDPASIRSIKIGMSEQEVIAILGQPLQIHPLSDDAAIYRYALPGWAVWSPVLWIEFRKGLVQTVQGKRYYMIGDDHAVYEARSDRPTAFEAPDFESTFSRAR